MYTPRLTDLDELALKVRDLTARSYITEAINSYRVGSYRSAVISAWIAVSYDIIAKAREIAEHGERNAQEFVWELDNAIANNNINKLQIIENQLLSKARDDFEFLAAHECRDLERLQEDRHRCAHPAFVSALELFQPTPDIVRAHLVHAITHLLQHQPVQGRSALERIRQDLLRPSFPSSLDRATSYLNQKYLDRAKETLISSLITVVLKALLTGNDDDFLEKEDRLIITLRVIQKGYPTLYLRMLENQLPRLVERAADNKILEVLRLLSVDDTYWELLSESSRIRILQLLDSFSKRDSTRILQATDYLIQRDAFGAVSIPDLAEPLQSLFTRLEERQIPKVLERTPHPIWITLFADTSITKYKEAGSYRGAEHIGQNLVLRMAPHYSPE
jgi:hypothetical protein